MLRDFFCVPQLIIIWDSTLIFSTAARYGSVATIVCTKCHPFGMDSRVVHCCHEVVYR